MTGTLWEAKPTAEDRRCVLVALVGIWVKKQQLWRIPQTYRQTQVHSGRSNTDTHTHTLTHTHAHVHTHALVHIKLNRRKAPNPQQSVLQPQSKLNSCGPVRQSCGRHGRTGETGRVLQEKASILRLQDTTLAFRSLSSLVIEMHRGITCSEVQFNRGRCREPNACEVCSTTHASQNSPADKSGVTPCFDNVDQRSGRTRSASVLSVM